MFNRHCGLAHYPGAEYISTSPLLNFFPQLDEYFCVVFQSNNTIDFANRTAKEWSSDEDSFLTIENFQKLWHCRFVSVILTKHRRNLCRFRWNSAKRPVVPSCKLLLSHKREMLKKCYQKLSKATLENIVLSRSKLSTGYWNVYTRICNWIFFLVCHYLHPYPMSDVRPTCRTFS